MLHARTTHTRYDCHKRVPPDLAKVLSELNRKANRSRFPNKNELRSAFKGGSRAYTDRGPADDLLRFLEQYGCVIQDGKRYYFDADRAAVVLRSCVARVMPPKAEPAEERLKALRWDDGDAEKLEDDDADDDEAAAVGEDETARFADGSQSDIAQISDELLDVLTTPAPQPETPLLPLSPAPVPAAEKPATRTVLFMEPVERVVWDHISASAHHNGSSRYSRPLDDDRWTFEIGLSEEGDKEEAIAALDSFVEHGLLRELSDVTSDKRAFIFVAHPSTFRIEPIDARDERTVTQEEAACIDKLQKTGFRPPNGYASLVQWIKTNAEELEAEVAANRMSSAANPGTADLGIVRLLGGSWHVTNPGFLPYRISVAVKETARRPEPPRPTPSRVPARTLDPARLSSMTRESVESRLAALQDQREHIDAQIEACQQELKRRKDEERLKLDASIERAQRELESMLRARAALES